MPTWTWGLIGIPALAGALLLLSCVLATWPGSVVHGRILAAARLVSGMAAYPVTLAAVGLATLGVLALSFHVGQDPDVAFEWLPGSGPITFGLGRTGLYAVGATVGSALLVLLGVPSQERPSTWGGALMLLTLSVAIAALLTHHFLARYVALETAAFCVALASLVDGSRENRGQRAGITYLLLRLGDVGLLAGILILAEASGTLEIDAALEVGRTLDAGRLRWAVAGLVWAAWVKMGGWPFHLWIQAGQRLSLATHAWLYATLMPNLGLYLLYRITPLLSLVGPVQGAAFWLGGIGAMVAMILAFLQPDQCPARVFLGAACGGLILFAAASGIKGMAWLSLLVFTPLRLLFFLLPGGTGKTRPFVQRMSVTFLSAVGGLGLTGFAMLCTYWAREAGAPLDALFIAEVAVSLSGIWSVRMVWRAMSARPAENFMPVNSLDGGVRQWVRWAVVGLLVGGVLLGGTALGPLLQHTSAAGSPALPGVPTLLELLRYAFTTPALLMAWAAALAATLAAAWLRRRAVRSLAVLSKQVINLEEGLARAARALYDVVEVGIHEEVIRLTVQGVLEGARLIHRGVEEGALEGTLQETARLVMGSGQVVYRLVEQEGLEGMLRRVVGGALATSRQVQRWHTGRLRRNLVWVVLCLLAAVLWLVVGGE